MSPILRYDDGRKKGHERGYNLLDGTRKCIKNGDNVLTGTRHHYQL